MASGKRIPFINVLRLLAMVFVLTPHLLAYQLENQVMTGTSRPTAGAGFSEAIPCTSCSIAGRWG